LIRRVTYKYKTKPYPHQVKALRFLVKHNGGAVYAPMRTGKCKISIDFACAMELKYGIKRVLVACPLSVISVWKKQIRIHSPESNLEWKIVNYEGLYDRQRTGGRSWEAVESKEIYDFAPDLIVVDEAHKIGNAQARQSRELYKLQRRQGTRFKVILTGTPFHRGKKLLVFGQFKFLDESVFGTAYGPFKSRYANFGGLGGHILLSYKNKKEFRKKIARKAWVMSRVPKVPHQHTIWSYPLEESEEAYEAMAVDSFALGIEAPNPLARATRLSQFTGGLVRDPEGNVVRVGGEKRRSFEGLLEELKDNGHEKVVVFSRWLLPMRDIGAVSRKMDYHVVPFHGGVDPLIRERRIDFFQESDEPTVFISQTATGALGIDLSAASVAVFYTLPSGLVDYDQDMARIQKFRDKRTLSYYYVLADGTIDEIQYLALREGIDLVKALERHPDLLRYRTAD
jgi:SNF2 family DNA or RNA helicase